MPNDERDLADTAHDLVHALLSLETFILYRRGHVPVYPDMLPNDDGTLRNALIPLTPAKARTFFSDRIEFWRLRALPSGAEREVTVTLSKSDAEAILESNQFIHPLPEIVALHARPLPIITAENLLRLPPPGYDPASRIYTYPA